MNSVAHPGASLQAVLFDLDGTLVDTADDFIPAVLQLQREFGTDPLPAERIRSCVSNGARALVALSLELMEGHQDFEKWRLRLLELYGDVLGQHAELYPGLSELLFHLEAGDIAWGVVTNKPRTFTEPLLDMLGLTPGSVVCPQDVTHPKPHPESLEKACRDLACEASKTVYIGDHERDIAAGRAAGMHSIAAAYGYIEPGDDAANWGADGLVKHSSEIARYLFDETFDTEHGATHG